MPKNTKALLPDVPRQIFESLLKKLVDESVDPEMVARLKKTLLEEIDLSDAAIREALFRDATGS